LRAEGLDLLLGKRRGDQRGPDLQRRYRIDADLLDTDYNSPTMRISEPSLLRSRSEMLNVERRRALIQVLAWRVHHRQRWDRKTVRCIETFWDWGVHMPRRNGAKMRPAADEFRKRAVILRDDALELGSAGRRLAGDALHQAGETAHVYYREGRARALEFERSLEELVRAYPIRSVCIAAAAGFLLARLLIRR
jgi:ElaB/YqjD/DUF883 family membrane-anchored ribosome-binding protein